MLHEHLDLSWTPFSDTNHLNAPSAMMISRTPYDRSMTYSKALARDLCDEVRCVNTSFLKEVSVYELMEERIRDAENVEIPLHLTALLIHQGDELQAIREREIAHLDHRI